MKTLLPRRGFTLLEMLTVVGIIALLATILIPVVSKVRQSARVADATNQMSQIASACERFKQERGYYPGPLPNSAFGPKADLSGLKITMTENGVLDLCGGLTATGTYDASTVGLGPMTLEANAARRKRLPPYIDPTPGQMMPNRNGTAWDGNGLLGATDSQIPEFMDRFSPSKPILYMRANVGAPGILGSTAQYNSDWLNPYLFAVNMLDFPAKTVGGVSVGAGLEAYFAHPTIPNVPRGQNTFILISAGPDGVYVTKDDILYP